MIFSHYNGLSSYFYCPFECTYALWVRRMPSQTPTTDCSEERSPPMDPETASTSTGNKKIPASTTSDPTDHLKVTGEAVSNTSTMENSKSDRPRFGAGVQAKEKLKFILGASEDYSSDDEPLVMGQATKPHPESTETPNAVPTMSSEVPSPLIPPTCLR